MVRSQLFEEQELLDALLRILPDSDPFLPVAEGFKSDILAQIRGVETASLRTLEGSCNVSVCAAVRASESEACAISFTV
jgi:hypothetical protein